MLIFGAWCLGWALYTGGEVRHAVESASRIYIVNTNASITDLQNAVTNQLVYVPANSITLNASSQTVGTATVEHITWSYQTTAVAPFLPSLPFNFSGNVDVPMPTP